MTRPLIVATSIATITRVRDWPNGLWSEVSEVSRKEHEAVAEHQMARQIVGLANGRHLASGHRHRHCDLFRSDGASCGSNDQLGGRGVNRGSPRLSSGTHAGEAGQAVKFERIMKLDTRAPEYKEADRQTPQQPVISTTRARQGVTGHNVRYVLGFGIGAGIVAFVILYVVYV